MDRKRCIALLLVLVFLLGIAAGCGSKSTDTKQAKYLRYNLGGEPETLDPRKSSGMRESVAEAQLFEGLTSWGQSDKIIPAAAEKWEVSSDGLVYTFHLRSDMKWSNGDPVTAHDFAYSWKTVLDPEFGSKYAHYLYYIKNGKEFNTRNAKADDVGVKALDDKTLVVTLNAPTSFFPMLVAHHAYYPVHRKTAEANTKWAVSHENFVCNGPFIMTKWTHNSKIELAKNANYWDKDKVKMSKLELLLVENQSTELAMFENGQLDMGESVLRSELKKLLNEKKAMIWPYFGTYYVTYNNQKAPFDNEKVRKAFSLAIDREAIVKNITMAGEIPAYGFVPPNAVDAAPDKDFRTAGGNLFQFNITEAKKLLAEAGYPEGKGLPPITMLYNTNELHKSICEAIQEMWKKNLGVEVTLVNQEVKVFLNNCSVGNFQVARMGWVGDYLDAMTMLGIFTSTSGNNETKWANAKFDQLIDFANHTTDTAKRIQALHEAERILVADDAAIAPLYFYTRPTIMSPHVKGVIKNSLGLTYFKETYLE